MAERTSKERVLVVRKTKLGESDLIVTMVASDGSQIRGVAKGARKPSSPFSARLELFAVSDILLAHGRSLDIVKEARLRNGHERLHADMEHAAAAAPVAELLWRVTQEELEVPRLFDMACTALDSMERSPAAAAPLICAGALLKTMAFCGFRPSLSRCARCGGPLSPNAYGLVPFSVEEGGAVCASCRPHAECALIPATTISLAEMLMLSTFKSIEGLPEDQSGAFSALKLAQQWIRQHAGCNLKSLGFLFTCGLF